MSFGSPLALAALIAVVAVFAAMLVVSRRKPRAPVAFTNLAVLEAVSTRHRRSLRRLVPPALLAAALIVATTAVAHPRARLPVRMDNATIVLLVDVSGSMSARDVEPTRLDAAVAAMRGFVQRLPKGFKVGLVQFSDYPDVLAAPTEDHDRISRTLDLLVPDSGTAIGSGIVSATALVRKSLAREGVIRTPGHKLPAAIVLLSDGKQNQGRIGPLAAAARSKAAGIVVDTVALGTTHGVLGYGPFAPRVAPDPPLMRAIARTTGGRSATATDSRELAKFYRDVGSSFGRGTRTRDLSSWFAAAAAILLVAAVALGRAWAGALPV
jgi:Ca-activated chloride channel family protein